MPIENQTVIKWPYPIRWEVTNNIETDILVLGGGIAGCWAAIAARKKGVKVTLVDKGNIKRSGASGSGVDHWESVPTNPCSKITPEELTYAKIKDHGGYNNGISHYIECREGYDRVLEIEKMGGKVRDNENEFVGAEFRDDNTKFLFAYDYHNKYNLRVWGSTFKPALFNECKRLGVEIIDRTMATKILTEKGKQSSRVVGAIGIHTRTGEFYTFNAKCVILCMARPARIWLFSASFPGICEFRPLQCMGDGHAMAWKVGAEFTMMEKSVRAEWSGEKSFPPYGTGNNHNTWYACSMVDAEGKEIPWVDRDGNILTNISDRYKPVPGQKMFLKGGGETYFHSYEFLGPDTIPTQKLLEMGYKLPFYADLSKMPELERKAIWGLMVGEEGKSKVPILKTYTEMGFDPEKHILQSYGEGWHSASFLPKERQLFGLPGGLINDWKLETNIEGLFAAGDQLFASDCFGHAAATGHYAGRHAAEYSLNNTLRKLDRKKVEEERIRIHKPLQLKIGLGWKEFNLHITRIMQNYCGEIKSEHLLKLGLEELKELRKQEIPILYASNPHELMRTLEVMNILSNAELIIQSCLARKSSAKQLHFKRSDYPELDPPEWHKFITIKNVNGAISVGEMPIDYYGDLKTCYEKNNIDYIGGD